MKTILSLRIQKYLARISIFLILIVLIAGMVGCGGGNGPDPYADYIKIYNWTDLNNIRNNLVAKYVLMNDLDSGTAGYTELASLTANQGKGWEPIGNLTESLEVVSFAGIFDGQDYKIRDFFINRPDELAVGLFSCVGEGGVVEKLGVVSATVSGGEAVGALGGLNCGNVSNCYSGGSVSGFGTGGLVGVNAGHVNNCHSTATVASTRAAGGLVGGNCGSGHCPELIGEDGVVSNSYATGNVSGYECVGGLVGSSGDAVSNSYSTGSVTGNSSVGGLVGLNDGTVTNSFWNTETSGQDISAGGEGKTTAEMQDITTFSAATWDITAVANASTRHLSYIWNIVDNETYPFLSWEPV